MVHSLFALQHGVSQLALLHRMDRHLRVAPAADTLGQLARIHQNGAMHVLGKRTQTRRQDQYIGI